MSSQPAASRVIRFGLFEVDLSAGELRKRDRTIKLQDQPFQVLALLLSRPGEVVTREELQQALWPADTFVEFDQGLNTAIKKIRVALGDSAENPRFIETVPRKGYRFIAPVTAPVNVPVVAPGAAPVTPDKKSGRLVVWWAVALLGLALVVSAVAWLLRPGQDPSPTPVPVPLTTYPGEENSPSFSPDGNYVAFAWNSRENRVEGNFSIYIKLIGGGDPVRLTHGPAHDISPAWSPDGRFIAFLRILSPITAGVFRIPALGGTENKVCEIYSSNDSGQSDLSWSPDGKWLVAGGDKETPAGRSALFRISLETGEKQRLTTPPQQAFGDTSPAVSPDGRALVFVRMTTDMGGDLFLLKLSSDLSPVGTPEPLTANMNVHSPAWTADGSAIVFSAGPPLSPGLWKLAMSTPTSRPGRPERLAFAGAGVQGPAISRQGRLAYTQYGMDVDIWRLELNGSRPASQPPHKLASSTRVDHDPRFSPDGMRIAFGSNRSGNMEIWVAGNDGSNPVRLTSFGGSSYCSSPHWSPDGRFIAFNATDGGKEAPYFISSEGGRPKRLAVDGLLDWSLSEWSRNGKWIYFGSSRGGANQLWKMPWPISEHAEGAIQVTRKGASRDAVESPDGKSVYYLKGPGEGDNTLWKAPAAGGEETLVLPSVLNNNFAVANDGIYFIPGSRPYSLHFSSFAAGKVTPIARIPQEPAWGLSVSPDGRSILYSEFEVLRADLMLVENFH